MQLTPFATGFSLLEAPRVDARGVWFSDIMDGGIRRLRPDGGMDLWLPDRRFIGGLAFNDDGRVICGGMGGLAWLDPETGASGVLLDRIAGQPIPGVNDICAAPDGGLFFGIVDQPAIAECRPLGPSTIHHLDTAGRVRKVHAAAFANGLAVSPDGRRLFVSDSSVGVFIYDLPLGEGEPKGTLLAPLEDGDGLALDAEGGVWVARILGGALTRLTPDGVADRQVPVPGGHVTSLCFGGADLRDVYVTTAAAGAGEAIMRGEPAAARTAALYRGRSDIAGAPAGVSRFSLA
jgi:gluconolactonase